LWTCFTKHTKLLSYAEGKLLYLALYAV